MKKLFQKALLFSACALLFGCSEPSNQQSCWVVGVSDGDTFRCLRSDKVQIKVRMLEIDAPESHQAFGNRAKQALSDLIYKQNVTLELHKHDRYGRDLAVVYNEQGQNVNLQMVEQGFAWAYNRKNRQYMAAEQQAREQRLGLWQDKNPIEPREFRKMARDK